LISWILPVWTGGEVSLSGDKTPCKVAPVIPHGVVSPECRSISGILPVWTGVKFLLVWTGGESELGVAWKGRAPPWGRSARTTCEPTGPVTRADICARSSFKWTDRHHSLKQTDRHFKRKDRHQASADHLRAHRACRPRRYLYSTHLINWHSKKVENSKKTTNF